MIVHFLIVQEIGIQVQVKARILLANFQDRQILVTWYYIIS